MIRGFIALAFVSVSFLATASNVYPFSDNENIELELSKNNYNRLYVANDSITKVFFSKDDLIIEYQKDGSVLVDLNLAEPFTVFFTTKQGHQFSATVKPIEALGKTVALQAKTPSFKARQFEKKTAVSDNTITQLLQAMMNNKTPLGYGSKSVFSSYKPINKDLSFKVEKQFIGDSYIGEILTVYNRSSKPIILDESWFKTKETRGIALSQPTLAPKKSETVYLAKEKVHV